MGFNCCIVSISFKDRGDGDELQEGVSGRQLQNGGSSRGLRAGNSDSDEP